MGFNLAGNTGTVVEVEAASLAMRVTARPADPGSLGAYAMAMDNGATVMTAGAQTNAPIFSFRWGNSNLCVLRSIRTYLYTMTTAFAAGRLDMAAYFARSFTASDSLGTASTITGANGKKRTSFGTTLITDIRISNTVPLTAGTRTLDTQPFARIGVNGLVTAANGNVIPPMTTMWQRDSGDEYPLVFAQNEGFVIQLTCPATGTYFFGVGIEWAEFATF